MDKVRIGIIGTGHISRKHALGYAYSGKAEIVAAADVNEEALRAFGREYNVSRLYRDYRELLDSGEVDAVSVCLPPFLHAPVSIDALNAGLHVLCEKPMCMNVAEAEAMVAAAERADRTLMVHYRYRYSNAHRKAKEIVRSGALGRIYFSRAIGHRFRGRPALDMKGAGRWFGDPEKAGAGVLFDLMGYSVDLLFWLLGFPEVKSVSAATFQEIDKERAEREGFRVDEFAAAQVRMADGSVAWLERSWAANMDPRSSGGVYLFGEKAGLAAGGPTLFRSDAEGNLVKEEFEVERDPEQASHVRPPAEFVEAVLSGNRRPNCNAQEGLYVQRLLDAMRDSAREGREVALRS